MPIYVIGFNDNVRTIRMKNDKWIG